MSTHGSPTRNRHERGVSTRETHGSLGFDPAAPTSDLYGSTLDMEQIQTERIAPDSVTEGKIGSGAVTSPKIADGAIDNITKFASSIRPPVVVDALPTLPDVNYPAGSLVFLTTTKLLYKTEDGATWTTVVDASDLTGTITETQIADDAISTPKLQANAVTAAKILAGTITADKIAANSLTAGQIASGAIGTDELAAGAVTAGRLNVAGTLMPDNMFPDPTFDLAGEGDTSSFEAIGSSFAIETVGSGTTYRRGRYRLALDRGASAGTTTQTRSVNIPVVARSADDDYLTVVLEHAIDQYTSGTVQFSIWCYDNTGALLNNAALESFSAAVAWPKRSVYRLKPYGQADPADGTPIDYTLPSNTSYIRLAWDDNGSAIQLRWYVTGVGLYRGLVPALAGAASMWDPAYSSVAVQPNGIVIRNGKLLVQDSTGATAITGGVVQTPGIAADAVTAGKLDIVGSSADNLIPDPLFEWGGYGDTSGWSIVGSGFTFNAVSAGTYYKRGSHRLRLLLSAAQTTAMMTNYIPINAFHSADGDYFTACIEHAGSITGGAVTFKWYAYNSSLTQLNAGVLQSWSSSPSWPTREVFRFKSYGMNNPADGTPIDVTLPDGTAYIRFALDDNSTNTTCTWYCTFLGFFQGLTAHWSQGSPSSWDTGYSSVAVNSNGILIRNGRIVVSNPGSTVVIDGTSNMFKIQASGTAVSSFPSVATSPHNNEATIGTGFSAVPAFLMNATLSTASASPYRVPHDPVVMLAYPSNDGKIWARAGGYVYIPSGTTLKVGCFADSVLVNPGTTAGISYYILKESGI